MYFLPFVILADTRKPIEVNIDTAEIEDLEATRGVPEWQTDWTIAYGIKYSIDRGCRGDVVFDAKTDELARRYEADFHARRIPSLESGGPKRYMLADEDAWQLFSKFLKEE